MNNLLVGGKTKNKKYSARYKKGFREGFNNPSQYMNINLSHPNSNDELIKGIIGGVIKRKKVEQRFIWSEKDLQELIE